MIRRFSVNFAIFSIVLDALFVMFSLAFAGYIRPLLNTQSFAQEVTDVNIPISLYGIFAIIWVLVLLLFSIYDGRKNLRYFDEFTSLTIAVILAMITSSGALYISFRNLSRVLFFSFVILTYGLLLLWRILHRIIRRWSAFPAKQRNVLIVGAGKIGQDVRKMIEKHKDFGLSFVGYLDDTDSSSNILGYLSEVRKVVGEKQIKDVIFALPGWAYERVNNLVSEIYNLPIRVWVIPDYFSIALHRAVIEEYAGIPMLDLRAPALNEYQRMIKRTFDLILSAIVLPPALIVFFIAAIIVKITSRGPVIYSQTRVGENGRIFEMYKIRSMYTSDGQTKDALGNSTADKRSKSRDDPRVTPIGKFLRRTSIDEIPQLFNILKGEMSLVGPRPELPHLVDKYEAWQRTRFAVPPGLTGWWQITGRSDKPMHLHTEDDLYYVQNYSLALDISIILKTFWIVIQGKGAY